MIRQGRCGSSAAAIRSGHLLMRVPSGGMPLQRVYLRVADENRAQSPGRWSRSEENWRLAISNEAIDYA
jgi:hypothetical protein